MTVEHGTHIAVPKDVQWWHRQHRQEDEGCGNESTSRRARDWFPFWCVVGLDNMCGTLTGLVVLDAVMASINGGKDVCCGPAFDAIACKTSMSLATRATSVFQVVGGIASILTIPMIGRAADIYGRKPLFVLTFLCSEVPALALVGVTHFNFSVYVYFATSMLLQMVPALSLFLLWINDCTAPEDRIKISARFEAFKSMEGIFVPLMVKVINGELTVSLIAYLRLLEMMIALCCLKESFQPRSTRARHALSQTWKAVKDVWRDVPRLCSFKATRSIFLLGFFATGTGLATISILFPFCKARFGVSRQTFSLLLIIQTASNAVVQFCITPRLKRWGLRCIFATGLACGAANLLAFMLSPSFSVLLGLATVAGFGSMGGPAFQTLMMDFVDSAATSETERGALLATLLALQNLFVVLMPPLYQAIFSVFVSPSMYGGRLMALPMAFGVFCQFVCILVLLRLSPEVFYPSSSSANRSLTS